MPLWIKMKDVILRNSENVIVIYVFMKIHMSNQVDFI